MQAKSIERPCLQGPVTLILDVWRGACFFILVAIGRWDRDQGLDHDASKLGEQYLRCVYEHDRDNFHCSGQDIGTAEELISTN